MAISEENVVAFLEDLYQKAYPAAQGNGKKWNILLNKILD